MITTETLLSRFSNTLDMPASARLRDTVEQREYLVDGRIMEHNGSVQDVMSAVFVHDGTAYEPVRLGSYPMLTGSEAMEALDAACRAYDSGQGRWPTLAVAERVAVMEEFVRAMKGVREDVVRMLMWEIGKPLADSEKEFDRTVEYIIDTIESLKDLDRVSSRFQIAQGIVGQIRRAPLGVVLCMGPYNYPLNETFTTLIPALLMGNVVVFKPPRVGVLLHRPLLKLFATVFPPGVVNTVYGDGPEVVGPMMRSGRVDCLAFIGSSRVADILKSQHPKPHRLRCVLGLEAKNLGIVLPDANLPSALDECVLGSLSFNGQRCTALKLLFVHEDIRDEFVQGFCQRVDSLEFGFPWRPGVRLTPLPEMERVREMGALVADAVSRGATVANSMGGMTVGSYFHPAVLTGVRPGMRIWNEEQFGPVVPVATYRDVSDPVKAVVESNYGQQVSLFGCDAGALASLIDPLVNQVCRVNVNSQCQRGPDSFPFTGRKDSAEGTLSVSDALRVFSIRTLVAAKLTDSNKDIIQDITHNRLSSFLSTDFIL